jgi:hypothetical protein
VLAILLLSRLRKSCHEPVSAGVLSPNLDWRFDEQVLVQQ